MGYLPFALAGLKQMDSGKRVVEFYLFLYGFFRPKADIKTDGV